MFETERLRLRELRQSDLSLVLEMFNNYEFQENGGVDYTVPRGDNFIEGWAGWAKSCFIALKISVTKNRDAEFTIGIIASEWGQGFGTEASRWLIGYGFRGLNLHRISLTVTATNDRAVAVYKKVGFVEEGRKRAAMWSQGKWVDHITMGILEEEFLSA
ncbi:acyl-CoA N-acyltransferase [Lentinula aff. detonsa]|uniref:Acyl-CoA N-acyltransferase n=1 Tax=Lentinula aff. detonsa TaxID=2804958 RepID=A0AA38KZL5_9AGAR|nr:acyl-CoA N-acyltransferase [Lentinula aff. detonsa]